MSECNHVINAHGSCQYCHKGQPELAIEELGLKLAAANRRVEELEAMYRHRHKACYRDGELLRVCNQCGLDLADPIHMRATPPPAAKEESDAV